MKLSIVSTLYYTETHLMEFYKRVSISAEALFEDDYEIILVNDASPDNSLALAIELTRIEPKLTVVDLSRNYGHHKAIWAGLHRAKGDLIFLIDSDLEEEPELLKDFFDLLEAKAADVVFGFQENRRGGVKEKLSGAFYYWILTKIADVPHPKNISTIRLMTKNYLSSLLRYEEREIVFSLLCHDAGYVQIPAPILKVRRRVSTYSLRRKISLFFRGIMSFSGKPLECIFWTGLGVFFFSMGTFLFYFMRYLFFGVSVEGFTSLILSIYLIGGLTILFLGVIGMYLQNIFFEVKRRPVYIIKDVYENGIEVD